MNDTWTDRLSEYIDGTLGETERGALEAHLAGCAACATALDELRRVVARARALDDRPPAADLWPGIAEQIGVSSGAHQVVSLAERRTRRRVAFTVPQLAAAAALLLLLGSGSAYLALHRPPLGAGGAIAQRGPAADLTVAPVGARARDRAARQRHGARAHTEPGDDRLRDRAGAAGARGRSRQRVFESTPCRHHAAQVGAPAAGQCAGTGQDLGG